MGLSVVVGMLAELIEDDGEGAEWLRESFANVNDVLAEHGLPPHLEPEELVLTDDRSIISSFPYSFLHYLRRAYARWKREPHLPATACGPDEDPSSDPAIDEESSMFESHLLCHSDCEGFYLPIRFEEVLVDDAGGDRIPGGLLGSSFMLLDELTSMAPCLGIALLSGELADSEAETIGAKVQEESDLWIELGVWLTLNEAARLSIKHNSAICFS
jgi:hypothetical protein